VPCPAASWLLQAQKAEYREVPHLQPAIRHTHSRRSAHPQALDLLADRLTDPKLGPYVKSVRDEVRNGTLLSDAFRMQGIFPKIYVTTVMAGEKSGSLGEVLDRFITYQKMSLA